MASYSGMSEYDIRVREDYKKQQAAAITASRDYKKNNYLSAMEQQTATQPAVTTTPKTNTNTQTLGGSSSTGGSSSSGGYTGGGYIAGSGTTSRNARRNAHAADIRSGYKLRNDAYNETQNLPYYTKLSDYDRGVREQYFYDTAVQQEKTAREIQSLEDENTELFVQSVPIAQRASAGANGARHHNNFLQNQIVDNNIRINMLQDGLGNTVSSSPEKEHYTGTPVYDLYTLEDAYEQVNQLPYANKLSDYDKDVRADFFLEVKPKNFSYVDPSAPLHDQFLQVQNGIFNGNQVLQEREADVKWLQHIYEINPTPENKAQLEQHWAQYYNELSAYKDLLNQYDKDHSSQGAAARILDLDEVIANYKQQLAEKEAALAGYSRSLGGNGQVLQLQTEIDELKETINRYDAAKEDNAVLYYNLENQEQFQKLAEDDHMSLMYAHAQTTQEDLGKLMDVLQYADDGRTFDYASLNDKTEYLAEKYGLTQEDIENYTIYGRTDLMDELKRQLDYAKDALAASGYDYDRMTEYVRTQERAKERAEEKAATEAYAAEHPGAASLASFLFSLGRVPEYAATMLKGIGHSNPSNYQEFVPMNTYDMHATNTVHDIRSTVAENIDSGVGKFLYQTGMSMADTALMLGVSTVTGVPQIATVCMGMSTAADEARDILERGGSNRQAFWGGLAAGAAEAIFEKFSVDDLLNKKTISGVKELLTETLKHSAIEGGEEMATEITNIISDAVIMGDKSRFNGLVEHYVSQGMTEEQAKQKATLDKIGEVTMAGIGGAFSGGIFGSMANGVNYVTAQSLGQAVKTEGLTPTVLQEALTLPADSQAHQMAQDLTDKLNTGLTELGLDLSSEYQITQADQKGLIQQVSDTVLSDQAVGELTRLVEQESLTQTQNHGKVDMNKHLSEIGEDSAIENTGLSRELIQELKANNVKFSQKDMLFITKDQTNQVVWLEKGNPNAGLEHIINGNGINKGHSQDFFNAFGVTKEELPSYLKKVITNGTVVSNKLKSIGKHQGYERIYYYNGGYHVVTGIGTNGFIVSAYPKRKS